MNQAIDNFLERPLWQKVGFWVGTIVFVSYCSYQFLLKDQWDTETALQEKVDSLNNSIVQEQRISRELNRFRKEVKELEIKLKFALQELPDKREIPDLLTSISGLARDSGLTVNLFRPMPESFKDFYAEVPVSISVEGTYHQIASFFDEVGHLPRIVNLTQITIKDPHVGETQVNVKSECVATTFRYLDESERIQNPEANDKAKRKKR